MNNQAEDSSFLQNRGFQYGVRHLLSPLNGTLEQVLEKSLGLTSDQTRALLHLGAIYLQGKRLNESAQQTEIKAQTYLRIHQTPRRFPIEKLNPTQCLVYEDDGLFIVNKPAGLPVHPSVDNIQENVLTLLKQFYQQPLFITHRLDVATEGLLVFAKTKEQQSKINSAFESGLTKKFYRALVHGQELPTGRWLHYMQPSPRAPKTVSKTEQAQWKTCQLDLFEQKKLGENQSEVQIQLLTGRTHQIRAQLSCEGFPVIGDKAYGSNMQISENEEICLQAYELHLPTSPLEGAMLEFHLPRPPWPTN
ncbi:MAG: RluA family pseudouridine synthase [Bdellovibrio sp. CG10_big_fil_rev_8_21_14_0_10_47_8]|nr:MAG: RluA family pseudouridine synthase [Bdellovibrio sp. CG10_big_fil_rev_8_21_14_0_10_47_8]